jgi:hypothetical protein
VKFGKENELKRDEIGNKKLQLNNFLAYLIERFDINKNIYYLLLNSIPAMLKTLLLVSLVILACWSHPHDPVGVCPDYKGLIQHGICLQ